MSEPRRWLKTSFASHWLAAALLAGPGVAVAVPPVTITPASGGSAISAETASNAISPAWTALGPITIAELNKGEFSSGTAVTLVLKVPAGFQFDTGTTPNASFTAGGDINNATVAVTDASTLTVTLGVAGTGADDTLTLGGVTPIRVRPTAKTPLATGNHIYRPSTGGGSAIISGVTTSADGSSGSDFGDLTEVAGAATIVRVESKADGTGVVVPSLNLTAGASTNIFAITRDAYSNFVANVAADSWTLPSKTGGVANGDLLPAGDSKSATFTGRVVGTASIRATSGALATTDSGTLTVVAGAATKLFVTLPGQTFYVGLGNSNAPNTQIAGTPFTITRLTAVDNFTNIDTSYSGAKTIAYAGPSGTVTYVTAVNFTAGESTTTLTTVLRAAETTTISASASGVSAVPSSSLTVNPAAFARLQLLVPGESAAPGTVAGKTGTPSAQTANVALAVRVRAVDTNWNVIASVADVTSISSSDANATLPGSAALVNGTNLLAVIFKTAGTSTLTAADVTDGSKTASTSPAITVNVGTFAQLQVLVPGETAAPGSPTGKTGTPSNQVAGTAFSVTVNGVDSSWNRVTSANGSGYTMRVLSSDPNATLPGTADLISGTLSFSVTLNTAGSGTITVTNMDTAAMAPAVSPAVPVNVGAFNKLQVLVPGETAAPGSATGKIGAPSVQNPGSAFSVAVRSVDANWNLIDTNDTIRLYSSDVAAVLPPNAALVNGAQFFSVTLNTTGSRTVTASNVTHSAITTNMSSPIPVAAGSYVRLQVLMPGETAAPNTPTGKTGTPAAQTAGTSFNLIVNSVDASWNVVTNITNPVALTSTDTNATLPGSLALAAGTRSIAVTNKTAGIQTITATDLSDGSKTPDTGSAFTVNTGIASKLAILTQPSSSAVAGVAFAQQPVVAIQDAFGNHRSNDTLSVAVACIAGGGNLFGTTNLAAVGGVATFTNLSHRVATNITLRFSSGALTAATSAVVNVSSAPFTQLLVLLPGEVNAPATATGKSGTPGAGAGSNTTVRVQAVDNYFNPVAGATDTVGVSTTDTNATAPASAPLANGSNTFNLIFRTAGNQTVTATDLIDGTKTNGLDIVTVSVGAFAQLQVLVPGESARPGTASGKIGTPSNQVAGTAFSVTVNGVDSSWNVVPGASGSGFTMRVLSSDTNATLPAAADLSFGTAAFSVTLKTAGSWTLTATNVDDASMAQAVSAAIPVNPGLFAKLQLLVPDEIAAPGSTSGKIGTPLMQSVGGPFAVTVNAVDALWNVINTNDTVHLTSSDTSAGLPADAALTNGTRVMNVTLNTAGSRTVTAWDVTHPSITSNTSPAITVSTNAFVKLQILMPGETNAPGTPSGKTGSPIAQTAGTAFNVIVNAVDANWNIVNTVTNLIQITSSDTNAVLPADTRLNSGTRTFNVTLRTSGARTVTADDIEHVGIVPVTGSNVVVNPAAANKLVIGTQPSTTASVGVPFSQQPVIFIKDQYNNIRSNDALVVSAHRSAGVSNLLGTTNLTSVNGVVTYTNLAHPTATNITIQFTSGALTAAISSNIMIFSGNAPIIQAVQAITGPSIYVDHPALYRFYLFDQETSSNNLQLSFSSSNPMLFPTQNAVFNYFPFDPDGQHWYMTLVPAFGQTGIATNTLYVSDGTNVTTTNFVLTVTPPPGGGVRFANTNAITIGASGPASPYPSTNIVSGMGGVITNLTLTLSKITHQWIRDVHVLLVSPSGQAMPVFTRVSAGPVSEITATLTDAALFPLPPSDGFALWSEQFWPRDYAPADTNNSVANHFPAPAPAGPYAAVTPTNAFKNAFNGLSANGEWYLYIYDENAPSFGTIAGGWSLMISTDGASEPLISDIPNQSTTTGTATPVIPFTIGDHDFPATSLTLSAGSSNPSLVPTNNIVFGGSGSNRTVTVTPAAAQTGTAIITVSVSNGAKSTNDTFALTVSTLNTPPVAAGLSDLAIDKNTSTGPLAFTVGDAQAAAENLNLLRSSSNPTLVPTNNIVFGGSGSNRTVTVTPAFAQIGTATISVTVSDGQLSTNLSFLLTVNAVNAAPTISDIGNQSTPLDTATSAIAFTVGDEETSASSLTLSGGSSNPTLVPTNSIVFGGSGSNRTVTITPVSGQLGSVTITVTVSDGTNSASDNFLLTVTASRTFTNTAAITIPSTGAGTPYPSIINVSGMAGLITNVTVTIHGLNHQWSRDPAAILVGPSGQTACLFSGIGGGGSLNNLTLTFSDAAPGLIPNNASLTSATYKGADWEFSDTNGYNDPLLPSPAPPRPSGQPYPPLLSAFNGLSANGNWSLYVADGSSVALSSGSIDGGWSLTISTSSTNNPPTITDIANQSTSVNTPTAAIPFTIGSAKTNASNLVLTAGSSNPTLVPTNNIVFGGSGSNRTVTVTPASNQVGSATITVTVSDGVETASDSFLLIVNPVPLTINIASTNRTYGAANPVFTGALVGVQPGDGITATFISAATTNSPVGAYAIVPVLNDPNGRLSKYTITTNVGTLTVTAASLAVNINGTNRTYGTPNPVFTGSVVGLQNGDAITASFNTAATTNSSVGSYAITATLADPNTKLGNYTITTNGGTLTITPVSLAVNINSTNRTYGVANPIFTGSLTGLRNGDAITASFSSATTTNSAVGGYAITATLADPGTKLGNYTVTTNGGNLTITGAGLVVNVGSASRSYGATNPVLTGLLVGLQNGDAITASFGTVATTNSPVGTYAITVTLADPGNKLGNYLASTNSGTLTVTAAVVTVTANNQSRAYGATNRLFTASYSGFVNAESTNVLSGSPVLSTSAGTNSAVGSYPIEISQGSLSNANYSFVFSNGTLTVTAFALSINIDSTNRVYGAANPALTGSLVGLQNGDNFAAGFSSTATTNSSVGSYAITASLNDPGSKLGNYTVTTNGGTLTVTAASLTVNINSTNRTYGAVNPVFTGALAGLRNGDAITAGFSSAATTNSPVGSYPITATLADPGTTLGNYAVTTNNGTLTVTAAALAVNINSTNRAYGAANPVFNGALVGLQNGDAITETFTSAATTNSPVGIYAITASLSDPGSKLGNYTVTTNGGTLTITPASLAVNINSTSRAYGATNPVFTGTVVGLQNGDAITASFTSAAATNSLVGAYAITALLNDPGSKLGNYTLTTNGGTLAITPAALLVAANNASRAYGATNPIFSASYGGFVNGETVAALLGSPALATSADTNSPVGTYAITAVQGTLSNANYSFVFSNGTLTVTAYTLLVNVDHASRTYGVTNPVFAGSVAGLQNGDAITASFNTIATTNSPVGSYLITASLTDPGSKLGNYTVTTNSGTLSVTAAALTVTANNATRGYGAANPAFTGSLAGVQNGDNIAALFGSSADTNSPVGSYAIIASLTDPGSRLGNYTVITNNGTLTITPAALLVAANNASRAYGAANPAFRASYSGFVNGEGTNVLSGSPLLTTAADTNSPVGSYAITTAQGTLSSANYSFVFSNGMLTVTAFALTINIESTNRTYGATNPVFNGTLVGLQSGDAITATLTSAAATNSPVGSHAITASLNDPGSKLGNYTVTTNGGTLTITPAPLAVNIESLSRAYGATNPVLTGSVTGLQNGDVVSASYATSATTNSPVGNYAITVALADPGTKLDNYALATNGGTLTVTAAVLVVVAENASRVYGATNPVFTASYSGFVNGEGPNMLSGSPLLTTSADTNSAIGIYAIEISQDTLSNANYSFSFTNGMLTITPYALTINVDSTNRTYGAANPAFSGALVGLQSGDGITASFSCAATTNTPVGSYAITASVSDPGSKLGNYFVTTNSGTLTITPASLLVAANNASRAYGAANPVFTASYSGLVNGENTNVLSGSQVLTTSADTNSAVGTHAIVADLGTLAATNYSFVLSNGTLTVTPYALVVNVDSTNRTYGAANPVFTGSVVGLQNGDTISASFGTTANTNSPVGGYVITAVLPDPGTKLVNYTVTTNGGTLTITAAGLAVNIDSTNRIYGAADPVFTGTLVGLRNGDAISASFITTANTNSPVGSYVITAALNDLGSKLGNYTVTTNGGTLTISAAFLTVSADGTNRSYGVVNPGLTGTLAGLQNGDAITASFSSVATTNSPVGTYSILPALIDPGTKLGNYAIVTNAGTLTITPAALVVSVDSTNRVFGTTNPIFTGALVGLSNGDNITATFSSAATSNSPAGTYPIVPTLTDPQARLGNYSVTTNQGTLTIGTGTPPHIDRIEMMGNGHMHITGRGDSNANYKVLATTNLTLPDWQEIGTVTSGPDGVWDYTDTTAPGFTNRFYLVKWP